MTLLLLYLFLALIVSFLCSIMEAVLLSTPVSYLKMMDKSGNKHAKRLDLLKQKIDRPLSAILSLNTVAHTVGAAGVGAQAISVFGEVYFGIVSAVLTILILIFTEIIPKTIGARYWRKFTTPVSILIKISIFVTYPLVILSSFITRMVSGNSQEQKTSREEFSILANISRQEGTIGEKEHNIIQNLIKLQDIRVSEVMTPRVVVSLADENMELEEFLTKKDLLRFSRIPVFSQNRENVVGYIFRQKVFEKLAEDVSNLKLKDIKRNIVFIPETVALLDAWDILMKNKEHIAMVIDEFGGMDGIITMEDIIESLLGIEIVDEKDTITDMQQYAKDRWQKRQNEYNKMNDLIYLKK